MGVTNDIQKPVRPADLSQHESQSTSLNSASFTGSDLREQAQQALGAADPDRVRRVSSTIQEDSAFEGALNTPNPDRWGGAPNAEDSNGKYFDPSKFFDTASQTPLNTQGNAVLYGADWTGRTERITELLGSETVAGQLLSDNPEQEVAFVVGKTLSIDPKSNSISGAWARNTASYDERNVVFVNPQSFEELKGISSQRMANNGALMATLNNEVTEIINTSRIDADSPGLGSRIVGSRQYQTLNVGLSEVIGTAQETIKGTGDAKGNPLQINEVLSRYKPGELAPKLDAYVKANSSYQQNNITPADYPRLEKELNILIEQHAKVHPVFSTISAKIDMNTGELRINGK
jgi:hypothetical protein